MVVPMWVVILMGVVFLGIMGWEFFRASQLERILENTAWALGKYIDKFGDIEDEEKEETEV